MFRNLTIRTRLTVLGATAMLMLLTSLGVGLYSLRNLQSTLAASLLTAKTNSDAVAAFGTANVMLKSQVQEWKDILLRGNDPKAYDKHLANLGEKEKAVQASLKKGIEIMRQQGVPTRDTEALLKAHEDLGVKYREALKSFDKGDRLTGQAVDKLVQGVDGPISEGMAKAVEDLKAHADQDAAEINASAEATYQNILHFVWIFGVLGAAMLAVVSFVINRSLLGQIGGELSHAVDITRHIAEGDLTLAIPLQAGDGTSLMASMSHMQTHLRSIIGQVVTNAGKLTDVAGNLASSAQQVSISSSHQSEAAAAMASAVEEMTVSFDHVSSNAGEAYTVAKHAGELSVQGGAVVHDAVDEMNKIAVAVNQSAQFIQTLGEHSNQISAIVHTIKDIADQTNLLALNAAIEAARAGEQGRGFAVVADEVRKLAERTAQSTQEISGMIVTIHSGTQNAIASMQEGSSRVNDGVAMANRAGESMTQIRKGADKVVSEVNDITAALREQVTASHQVARNVEKIAEMTEENSAAVGEISDSSQNMKHLAEELKSAVGRFRL